MGSHRVGHEWSDLAAAAASRSLPTTSASRKTSEDHLSVVKAGNGMSQVAQVVKNLPANARDVRDMGLIPGSGRSPGGGHGRPL